MVRDVYEISHKKKYVPMYVKHVLYSTSNNICRVIDNSKEYPDFSFIFVGKPVEPMVFQGRKKKKIKGMSINVEAIMAF